MAGKNGSGTAYSPEATGRLITEAHAIITLIKQFVETRCSLTKQVETDEILGDCEMRDTLQEVLGHYDESDASRCTGTYKVYGNALEKLSLAEKTMAEVNETLDASSKANINATAENSSTVADTANKIADTTGAAK